MNPVQSAPQVLPAHNPSPKLPGSPSDLPPVLPPTKTDAAVGDKPVLPIPTQGAEPARQQGEQPSSKPQSQKVESQQAQSPAAPHSDTHSDTKGGKDNSPPDSDDQSRQNRPGIRRDDAAKPLHDEPKQRGHA